MNLTDTQTSGGLFLGSVIARRILQAVACSIVFIMATVTPWLFGAVDARTVSWLLVGSAAAIICCLLRLVLDGKTPANIPLAVAPLLGAMGLGLLQITSLPAPVRDALSPAGSELRRELDAPPSHDRTADAQPKQAAPPAGDGPVSLYPASTRQDLALLALATTAFVLGAFWFHAGPIQLWLFGLVAANGAAFVLFGIVQQLSYNGQLYWVRSLADGGRPFAAFVNRNNAGGYLNLCLAAAVGLTVWATGRHRGATYVGGCSASSGGMSRASRWRQRSMNVMAQLDRPTVTVLVLACTLIAGVLCTFSRGAGLAMAGAAFVAASVLVLSRRNAALAVGWIATAAVGASLLVGWLGYRESVRSRYAGLLDGASLVNESRLAHWADSIRVVPEFWRVGSGLGTYRYVYPGYQSRLNEKWFYHAENQYLEALVEGGALGLGLLICAMVMIGLACRRSLRVSSNRQNLAVGAMGVFALTSQVIHAFFDFGLYIPANLFLFALLCGSVAGTSERPRSTRRACRRLPASVFGRAPDKDLPPSSRPLPRYSHCAGHGEGTVESAARLRSLSALILLVLLGATVLGSREMHRVAVVERAMGQTDFEEPIPATRQWQLRRAIDRLETALVGRPDDAPGQYRVGRLVTQLFRVNLGQRRQQESEFNWDDALLWDASAPAAIHAHAHFLRRRSNSPDIDSLSNDPLVRDHLFKAQDHFLLARQACPLISRVHLRLAELSFLSGHRSSDATHLQRAVSLAPSDADLLFRCGLLDFQAERCGTAFATWKRSLSLTPRHLNDIVRLLRGRLSTDELITTVVPPSPEVLTQLAEDHFASESSASERLRIARRAEVLLDDNLCTQPELLRLRGRIRALQDRQAEAIADYRDALLLQSHNVELRYDLARLLAEQGNRTEARRQAEICAYQAPRNQRYVSLLNSLNSLNSR